MIVFGVYIVFVIIMFSAFKAINCIFINIFMYFCQRRTGVSMNLDMRLASFTKYLIHYETTIFELTIKILWMVNSFDCLISILKRI